MKNKKVKGMTYKEAFKILYDYKHGELVDYEEFLKAKERINRATTDEICKGFIDFVHMK